MSDLEDEKEEKPGADAVTRVKSLQITAKKDKSFKR
jgi:hypothetical protein